MGTPTERSEDQPAPPPAAASEPTPPDVADTPAAGPEQEEPDARKRASYLLRNSKL